MNLQAIYECYLSCSGVSTDTRKIEAGNLFFALKGPNFDANSFAAKALEIGAKAVVVDESFDWENDKPLNIPEHETIIYELHVKGFTKLNSHIPQQLRGTYAGLGHSTTIAYLKSLPVSWSQGALFLKQYEVLN